MRPRQNRTHFMQLQQVLQRYGVSNLTQAEINYLQLRMMEGLGVDMIARLLECDTAEIMRLEAKFSAPVPADYQPSARSTI